MTTEIPTPDAQPTFTPAQWQALHRLRDRYRQERDLFSAKEIASLRFLRWLSQQNRLVP